MVLHRAIAILSFFPSSSILLLLYETFDHECVGHTSAFALPWLKPIAFGHICVSESVGWPYLLHDQLTLSRTCGLPITKRLRVGLVLARRELDTEKIRMIHVCCNGKTSRHKVTVLPNP